MSLLISKVPRALETKSRLFGFELGDLLFVFLYLAISNLIFGQTRLKVPMVWLGTLGIGLTLYFVKRGKPDHFIQHTGEHFWAPGVLSAGVPDLDPTPYLPAIHSKEEKR